MRERRCSFLLMDFGELGEVVTFLAPGYLCLATLVNLLVEQVEKALLIFSQSSSTSCRSEYPKKGVPPRNGLPSFNTSNHNFYNVPIPTAYLDLARFGTRLHAYVDRAVYFCPKNYIRYAKVR